MTRRRQNANSRVERHIVIRIAILDDAWTEHQRLWLSKTDMRGKKDPTNDAFRLISITLHPSNRAAYLSFGNDC